MTIRITIVLLVALAVFVWWRYTSVSRGAAKRDAALLPLLDPLAEQLEAKAVVSPEAVAALAAHPEVRVLLHALLVHYDRRDLLPPEHLTLPAQAEAILAYWLMHPNELQAAPTLLEPVVSVSRPLNGRTAQFHVLRYQMPPGHWAGTEWLLGLAGPFFPDDPPYEGPAGGFSRAGDRYGVVSPESLVDWYVGMLQQKFGSGA